MNMLATMGERGGGEPIAAPSVCILKTISTNLSKRRAWVGPSGADLAFFQGGVWPIVHEPRSGEPILFWLFYEPRSGEPIFFGYFTSREAASRFFWLFYEPRSGEPIFLAILNPVSDVFLASTNAMETMITSLAAQGGGGGGLNPIVWGWAWDRVL